MAKIILQDNLIDLEMITHISVPVLSTDFSPGSYFFIQVIGGKYIEIRVTTKLKGGNWDHIESHLKIQQMYDALVKRWAPSMTKWEDITVR